ncbi:MAG: hypothetical protein WAW23_00755 [Candidatus Methanoperedens sp.]
MKNDNRFERREPLGSFIASVREIFNAHSCALYLTTDNSMDVLEKQREFKKRFPAGYETYGIAAEDVDQYNILKFIGVVDAYTDPRDNKRRYWDFDYKRRPNKYIVFSHIDNEDTIPGEGITGMTARRKRIIYLNKDEIRDCKARYPDNDTARGVHPECTEVLAIPILSENRCIGIMRLDIYDINNKDKLTLIVDGTNKDDALSELVTENIDSHAYIAINEICNRLITISSKNANMESYDSLFKGINILETIKSISGQVEAQGMDLNSQLYGLIEHLFFVFRRNAYIGYNEIMQRVINFLSDLFDLLGLQEYYTQMLEKLEEFRDHEKLMLYDIEKYRDHFMHQFHVFIVGYIIINFIGIQKITDIVNARLKNVSEFSAIAIQPDNLLRIWVFTSFFHDITYIIEKYQDKIMSFLSRQLKTELHINIDWGHLLSGEDPNVSHMNTLEKICSFFESPSATNMTNKDALLKNYVKAILSNQDHGVISALMLVELFLPLIHKKIENGVASDAHKANIEMVEIYLAASAISMHNSCVFNSLRENIPSNKRLIFEHFPIEFLLIYCDTCQEWGRKKKIDKITYDSPVLDKIELSGTSILCQLRYLTALIPDPDRLASFYSDKTNKFSSGTYDFSVNYTYATGKESDAFRFKG